MKELSKVAAVGALIVAGVQLIRPPIPSAPTSAEVQVPPHIRQILRKDCYSCHSSERRLSWFDEVAPGYWLVRHDVLTAREI